MQSNDEIDSRKVVESVVFLGSGEDEILMAG